MAKEDLVHFKKGEDPRRNKNGRPKGALSLTTMMREYLLEYSKGDKTHADELKEAMLKRAINKSDVMAKEIWDRVDGKVIQTTDITSGGKPITNPILGSVIPSNNSDFKDSETV